MIVPLEKSPLEDLVVKHISERPWSDYTEADYTLAQWHNACLIHQHSGPPTSKTQCKLPVKTPNGALNRNGVHAAAAALAGARSELKATSEEKAKARVALRRYYSQLDETPPDSLAQSAINHILERHGGDVVTPFEVSHAGVKGMHWGIRKEELTTTSRNSKRITVKGTENFPVDHAASMNNVANKLAKTYGYKIDEFVPLTPKFEKKGYIAYVDVSRKDNRHVINVSSNPKLKSDLIELQKSGWIVPSDPSKAIEANLTHEATHAIFHTSNVKGTVFKKYEPALIEKSRQNAWEKARSQAEKDGDIKPRTLAQKLTLRNLPETQVAKKISRYAEASPYWEETEAEMFSAYHWSKNPPKFVDTFVTSIHQDIGKDIPPFSGRKVSHA